jgi:DNA-directed RNA polymerase I subunit RPA12
MVAYENIVIATHSHPEAFPSALREKRKTKTKGTGEVETRLKASPWIVKFVSLIAIKVTEQCPQCGYHEAWSVEKQVSVRYAEKSMDLTRLSS